jgi:CheY-like chemotaxis protein
MMEQPKNFMGNILVAEDDPDDRLFVKQALKATGFTGNLKFVNDGHPTYEVFGLQQVPG